MQNTHISIITMLFTKGVEFIATGYNKVEALHNRQVLKFCQLPEFAYKTIKHLIGKDDVSLTEMEEFAYQRWGGMDDQPDIAECGTPNSPEYMEDVTPAYYDNGKQISSAEMRVLRLIRYNDEAIAEKLFISKHTVAGQVAAIYSNMDFEEGQNKRTATHDWGIKKGIL